MGEQSESMESNGIIDLKTDDIYLPSVIDLTCLEPNATEEDITDLCNFAVTHQYRAVCVNTCQWPLCASITTGNATRVAVVVDFPLGAGGVISKCFQVAAVVNEVDNWERKDGNEIDVVMNIGAYRSGNSKVVRNEIVEMVLTEIPAKIIIETGYWNDDQIRDLTKIVMDTGVFCIKTSTGWEPKVPLKEKARHVAIMREEIEKAGSKLLIKAAGGIKTPEDARLMLRAGASIIGSSARIL